MDTKKLLKAVGLPVVLGLIMFFDDVVLKLLSTDSSFVLWAFIGSLLSTITITVLCDIIKRKVTMIPIYAIMVDVSLKYLYIIYWQDLLTFFLVPIVLFFYCVISMFVVCAYKSFHHIEVEQENLSEVHKQKFLLKSVGISSLCCAGIVIGCFANATCIKAYLDTKNIGMLLLFELLHICIIVAIHLLNTKIKLSKSVFLFFVA